MRRAIEGVRFIENTIAVAGLICGMMLVDLDAEAIKIETKTCPVDSIRI